MYLKHKSLQLQEMGTKPPVSSVLLMLSMCLVEQGKKGVEKLVDELS